MSNELELKGSREVAFPWRWRDRFGEKHTPASMDTRHLFHTFRMIWNNFMPAHMRVGAVKLYTFSAHYNRRYLARAIEEFFHELSRRSNIQPAWQRELDEMASWLAKEGAAHLIEVRKPTEHELLPYKPQLGEL